MTLTRRAPVETAPPPPPAIEDEQEREARRERARAAANRARRKADDVQLQLEDWEAHLASGRLDHWITHADAVAGDSDLAAGDRRRLEEATALARQRLEAHEAYLDWQIACRAHDAAAELQGRHALDDPTGYHDLAARAGRLAENSDLSATARRAAAEWLAASKDMAEARLAFLERRLAWERLEAEAQAAGRNPLDLPETGDVVAWLRENLDSAGITEAERQAMRDVVSRHEARQAERKSRDRGFSWRM